MGFFFRILSDAYFRFVADILCDRSLFTHASLHSGVQ